MQNFIKDTDMSFCEMHCNCFIVSSKLSIWYAENRIFIHSGVSECHSYSLVWIIAIPSPLNNVMQIYFFIQNISLKVDILYWGYIYAMLLYAKSFNSKHTVKSCSLILAALLKLQACVWYQRLYNFRQNIFVLKLWYK